MCNEGEYLCPPDHDAAGCMMPETCVPVSDDPMADPMAGCPHTHSPDGCPIHPEMPPCMDGEFLCPTDYDSNGCEMPPTCAPPSEDPMTNACPMTHHSDGCPVIPPMDPCAVGEMWCDMGMDFNGCWMGSFCNAGDMCPPPPSPPPM